MKSERLERFEHVWKTDVQFFKIYVNRRPLGIHRTRRVDVEYTG